MECDHDAATFEADPLTDEDILSEFNHSADANEEEEEEIDGVLNTFSFFCR